MTPSNPLLPRRLLASVGALSGLALALAFAAPEARAIVMEALSLEQLTQRADAVVHGQVVGQTVRREGTNLWTTTELRVAEPLKGTAAGNLTFEQLGGTLDGRTQRIAGDAVFTLGEDVVVFLTKTPKGYVLYGFSQGKFTVAEDPVSGARTVTQDLSQASLVVRRGEAAPARYAPPTLDDFRAEIRSFAR
ncbi:MAG: hypothetical protein ACYCWW_20995 [Deltaproteobacteria bacterium]